MKKLFCLLCIWGWYTVPAYSQLDKLPKTLDGQKVYNNVDKMPQMPEGTVSYILNHLHFYENDSSDLTSKIVCFFIIDTFGKVREPIVKVNNNAIKIQVIELLKTMPLWQPAKKMSKKVPASFALPIILCW